MLNIETCPKPFLVTTKADETLSSSSNRYSNILINSYRNEHSPKENTISINSNDIISFSKTMPTPPQIGALKFNPAKMLEDSVRTNSSKSVFNTNSSKDRTSSLNANIEDLNINYSSDKANKSLVRENLELKTTIAKMAAELKENKSKMNSRPDVKDTIDKFLQNEPHSFDVYKSKRDKIKLLTEAISSHDGNAILAVVLFLKNSLFPEVFNGILISNPIALNQYVFHLEQMKYYSELADFYKFQGNSNEYANITYFKPILTNNNLDYNEKIQRFREYENKSNQTEINLANNSMIITPVRKHLSLLNIQKEILKNRSTFLRKDEAKQNSMDKLVKSSLSNTVAFCLKYNKELNENVSYSIENLKKEFDINTKQFSIWFIKSMSEIGSWSELENFTKQRGIFNMVKSPPVSFETIVFIISRVKGPPDQIRKYLNQIENIERRQALALKFKIVETVIETFKLQKDRIGLINYRNSFREGSSEYLKTNIAIADDRVKWKN